MSISPRAQTWRSKIPGRHHWATAAAVFYVVLWASAYVPSKIGATGAPPIWFLVVRFLIAGLIMAGITRVLGRSFPRQPRTVLLYAALGVLANAAYLTFTYSAMSHGLASGVGAIVASTNPLIVAVAAPWLLSESLTARKGLGLLFGFGGVFGVMLARSGSLSALPADVGLSLLGVTSNVASTLLFKRFHRETDLLAANTVQLLSAAAFLVPVAILNEGAPHAQVTATLLGSLAYLVLVLSVGASLLWFWLLSRGDASRVSAFYFLTPVFGLAFGAVLLQEPFGSGDVAGLAAVAIGIVLVQRG